MQNIVHLSRHGPSNTVIARYEYAPLVTEIIRTIPGREFKPAYKIWIFPGTPENVMLLKTRLAGIGWQLSIEPDLRASLNEQYRKVAQAAAVRTAGDAEVDFEFLTEPYAHQRAGLAFLAHLGSGALFWEMGLGKTKTAIDYAEWLAPHGDHPRDGYVGRYDGCPGCTFKALVICPNTVKRNWGDEIRKHAGHEDFIIPTGTIAKRITQLGLARYTIINVEAMSVASMARAVIEHPWDLVVADESTRFKTPGAKRTKAFHKLGKVTPRRVILTGTPITGAPQDAWSQLEFVQPGIFGSSFWAFTDRYLRKDFFGNVVGLKPENADELKARIDSRGYRILKDQVLDLPPKVYVDRRVEMVGEQRRAYNQMRDELRIEIEGMEEVRAANILTVLLRLTQVTAGLIGQGTEYRFIEDGAKVTELDALLNDELRDQQVVIFGLYQRELEALARRYDDGSYGIGPYALPIIYGPTPEKVRHELVAQFQAGNRRLLFVQSRTGGLGINLTKAQNAIYATRGWSLEEYLQSQDRLHRIGQTGTVNIIHLLAEDSIDNDIAKALADKQTLSDHLTGDTARKLALSILSK